MADDGEGELSANTQEVIPPLSKNAIKRKLKRQRWEDSKADRRAYKKAKLKEKKESLKLSGQKLPKKEKPVIRGQENTGIRVVIDCGFDELMTEKEIISMSSQLTRCHAENRRSLKQVEIYLTSLDKRLGERMETGMKGVHRRWKGVHASTDSYETALNDVRSEDLIYLTADSPNVIQSLERDKVYIIGGLVDRNRHKGICYEKAVKQGIQHGRLPIGDYIKMASRHVLTVNQVLEIMLRWLVSEEWEKAFMDVIPKRKLPETQANKEVESEQENGQTISDQDQQGSAEIMEEIDESENDEHVNAEESDDARGCI